MKILYYDCFSGISGDMNLGALIDLGVPFEYLLLELDKLKLNKEFKIQCNKDIKNGISGTKITVVELSSHSRHHNHQHGRNYNDIISIIKNSALKEEVKLLALNIFQEIAIAEAKIHNKPLLDVHFHEVGAIDSIIDIVGAAILIDYIKPDKIISSPIEVGYGLIQASHGIMPIPAPATLEILKGIPIKGENVPFEATTPTGAAIIKTLASAFTYKKDLKVINVGYGIGEKNNKNMANVLRIFLGEIAENEVKEKEYLLECNIDDMRAEEYELLMSRLFKEKALDVFYTNIFMKKERPAIKLSVLCTKEFKNKLKKIIFLNSSTIGIREYEVKRTKLERKFIEVECEYGNIPLKLAIYDGKVIRTKPEYDHCKKIAEDNNISLNEVYTKALLNYERMK